MTDKALKRIGLRLKAERTAHNLTQEQVATKAGISSNHYALIERGVKDPTTTTMTAIISAIGTSHHVIFEK